MENIDLRGKDYLTELEAAHYACVSHSQFRAQAAKVGIQPARFMGKKIYRREDLVRAIEKHWQPSPGAAARGSSPGRTRQASIVKS